MMEVYEALLRVTEHQHVFAMDENEMDKAFLRRTLMVHEHSMLSSIRLSINADRHGKFFSRVL